MHENLCVTRSHFVIFQVFFSVGNFYRIFYYLMNKESEKILIF